MSKPTAAVTNAYHARVYDRLSVLLPKGRLDDVKGYAAAHGTTVNALVGDLLRRELGMDLDTWKRKPTGPDDAASIQDTTGSTHPEGMDEAVRGG